MWDEHLCPLRRRENLPLIDILYPMSDGERSAKQNLTLDDVVSLMDSGQRDEFQRTLNELDVEAIHNNLTNGTISWDGIDEGQLNKQVLAGLNAKGWPHDDDAVSDLVHVSFKRTATHMPSS